MIYKKYAIEVVYVGNVVDYVELDSSKGYNDIRLILENRRKPFNTIKYMDDMGNLLDILVTFHTYEKAYDILDRYYGYIKNNHTYNIISVKIVECFDDITPPLNIMRMIKIKNIKNRINEKIL